MLGFRLIISSLIFVICAAVASWAAPISQVDQVTVSGPYYRSDQVTLTITGPITATLTYTATPDDEVGYNAYNVARHWSEAIATDSLISSLLSVSFLSPPDAAFPDSLFFTLTGKNAGEAFQAFVSVTEACDCDLNETIPIVAIITTLTAASDDSSTQVPEPSSTSILLGLLGGLFWKRSTNRFFENGWSHAEGAPPSPQRESMP